MTMGSPSGTSHPVDAEHCNLYPVLDYVKQLPVGVPALERPLSPYGTFTPIVPKSKGWKGPLPSGPADVTYYFALPLMKNKPAAVFFPSKFFPAHSRICPPPAGINVVLYFHGFKLGEFEHINKYLSGQLHGIQLRQDINSSGKRPVLIAPTLGESPGSASQPEDMMIFGKPGGVDTFFAEVLRAIAKYVPEYSERCMTPTIGNLVLAGHSGAGAILSNQIMNIPTTVAEVWGFDSLYGGAGPDIKKGVTVMDSGVVNAWVTLASANPNTKFFFHWGTNPLRTAGTKLEEIAKDPGLGNIKVMESKAPAGVAADTEAHHFAVLTDNFGRRVSDSKNLT
jgi:hypothetical protein